MTNRVRFMMNRANTADICRHLSGCCEPFISELKKRVSIKDYSEKIYNQAVRMEAWAADDLVGLLAAYCNDPIHHVAYVTSVSVLENWQSRDIAKRLMKQFIQYAEKIGVHSIRLEVEKDNTQAICLYRKFGFASEGTKDSYMKMHLICYRG